MNKKMDHAPVRSELPRIDWDAPDLSRMVEARPASGVPAECRLFRVAEISEGASDGYRLAMANVLSSLCDTGCSVVYMLAGRPEGVSLYMGVVGARPKADLREAARTLQASFEGNFLGAGLEVLCNQEMESLLVESCHVGLITGVPTLNEREGASDNEEFQGVERLVNSLVGETWQFVVVAEPARDEEIRATLEQIYDLSTQLSEHIKHSVQFGENSSRQESETRGTNESISVGTNESRTVGTNISKTHGGNEGRSKNQDVSGKSAGSSAGTSWSTAKGSSESDTAGTSHTKSEGGSQSRTEGETRGESLTLNRERIDKRAERLQKHLSEDLIERFLRGRSKGMFRVAMHVCAPNPSTFDRLSRGVLSIYQGNQSGISPLRVTRLDGPASTLADMLRIRRLDSAGAEVPRYSALAHSLPIAGSSGLVGATWLNTGELALLAGLPSKELPGIKIRKSVDFAVNAGPDDGGADRVLLGVVNQHGRDLEHKKVALPKAELNKHVFVTGVTGAGKTTTCMTLLLRSELPFMVIEPAKTEYRALHGKGHEIEYYVLGREDLTPFRLNPFELLRGQKNLAAHISTLNATMAAVFPMEAAMPYIVEEAIICAYKAKGWDVHSGENYLVDDPWAPLSDAWPTFSDMIGQLDGVIKSKGMGREFEEKYQGSLVARLSSLTKGVNGRMLDTRYSLDFSQLLDRRVVIELEEIKDEQHKALMMGFILYRLAECMKQRHRKSPGFQHLTLVEEAHRLLSRPEPGDPGAKRMGVEMFANLLAEVRKYGEGLIVADQIPNKLVADVIKNTNTKIVHRLFAADDRNTIGDSMGLSDEQKDFLPLLMPGETVIYCGGWHAPVRVKIDQGTRTDIQEIAEGEIREQGRRQLWEQRMTLLPRLASQPAMNDSNVLADFLQDGSGLLNRLLKVNYLRRNPRGVPTVATFRDSLAEGYSRHASRWRERLGCSSSELGALMACLFADVGPTLPCDFEDCKAVLTEAAALLQESLGALDGWIARGLGGGQNLFFNDNAFLGDRDSI